MDVQLFDAAWQLIQTHWHDFVNPIGLGMATETGKQTVLGILKLVKDHLVRTEEGKQALEVASTAPESPEARERVKALLQKNITEDPQFAAGLSGKFHHSGILVDIFGKDANVVIIETNTAPIDMRRGRSKN